MKRNYICLTISTRWSLCILVLHAAILITILAPKQDPFRLSKGMEAKFAISESNHKLFMGAWYPRVVQTSRSVMRDTSKTFLYEIRNLS